jgi:predicted amidohydrolase YtcJ
VVDVLETRNRGGHGRRWGRVRIATLFALATAAVTATAALNASAQEPADPADTVFLNAKALRYADQVPPYGDQGSTSFSEAVAVTDGKISYVGDEPGARALIGSDTKVLDLDGRMMMPGIIDAHWHGQGFVTCHMGYEGGTIDSILAKLKACLTREDQLPLLNGNTLFTASFFLAEDVQPPGTAFDRHVLDRLSADPSLDPYGTGTTRPIRIAHSDAHKSYTNTKAIQNAGLDENTPDPPGGFIGREPNGYPSGVFSDFNANWGPAPPAVPNQALIGLRNAVAESSSKGLTTIVQMLGSNAGAGRYKTLADEGTLEVNVENTISAGALRGQTDPAAIQTFLTNAAATRDANDGYSSPNSPGVLTMKGILKLFCDGVAEFPVQTAAMHEPYNVNTGTPEDPVWTPGTNRGPDPSCSDSRLAFVEAHKAGWSFITHSIGDRAVTDSLDNFEAAQRAERWDSRDSITHAQFIRPSDYARFSQIGVTANLQMQWASRDAYMSGVEGYVNPSLYNSAYPAGSLHRAGAVLVGGSDWPIDPLLPFQQIETAVDRLSDVPEYLEQWPGPLGGPGEALTLDQSLMMHTIGSAYGIFQEDETGSIDVGKNADLIVLDRNLYEVPVGDISDTKVLLTMTRGKVVHEAPEAASFDAEGAKVVAEAPQFPVQAAGTIGPLRKVTVTAGGDRTLKLGDVTIEGEPGSEGDFLMTSENCSDRSLAVGASCTIGVRFAPAEGNRTSSGSIVIGANISGNEHRVPLNAQSSAPKPQAKANKCAKKKSAKAKKKCKKKKRKKKRS